MVFASPSFGRRGRGGACGRPNDEGATAALHCFDSANLVRTRVLDFLTGHQRKEAGISDEIPASLVTHSGAKSNP